MHPYYTPFLVSVNCNILKGDLCMLCPRCSAELPPGALFCPRCGKKVSAAAPSSQKHRRRAKGTGSVYKLQGQRERPWVAYAHGHVIGTCRTSGEALALLEQYNASKAPADLRRITFAAVYDQWSAQHYKAIGPKGQQSYALAYAAAEPLHARSIADLGTSDYQSIIDSLVAAGRSRSTCEKQRQLFSQLCQWAMTRDVIDKNYAQFLDLPAGAAKKTRVFSDMEVALIWTMEDDTRLGDTARIALILIYTGMRINELLLMRRENVHLAERYMVGGEKTEAGRDRPIPIDSCILPLIEHFLEGNTTEWLIPSANGNPRDHNTVRKSFRSLMDKLGIQDVTPHTCRHTAASRWAAQGVPIQSVKEILGHSSIQTTSDIYTHVDPASLVRALDDAKLNSSKKKI